jgi:hypothetical protein
LPNVLSKTEKILKKYESIKNNLQIKISKIPYT